MHENIEITPGRIEENGWKQGAFLTINGTTRIFTEHNLTNHQLSEGLYIVISQDCDILSPHLKKEPFIELIMAKEIIPHNDELSSGKNPRQLHLEATLEGNKTHLEFHPYNKLFISRHYLQELVADSHIIEPRELKILIAWLCKRYRRAGFPDEFNRRISENSKTLKKIRNILSTSAKRSLGLFIQLNTDRELEKSETYKIILIILIRKEIYDTNEKLLIENGFDEIIGELTKIKGITIIEGSQVLSDDDITLHRYQELKQWDFDYLSFLKGEEGDILDANYSQ